MGLNHPPTSVGGIPRVFRTVSAVGGITQVLRPVTARRRNAGCCLEQVTRARPSAVPARGSSCPGQLKFRVEAQGCGEMRNAPLRFSLHKQNQTHHLLIFAGGGVKCSRGILEVGAVPPLPPELMASGDRAMLS